MVSSGKTKNNNSSSREGWGLGLFFVFFPDDGDVDKKTLFKPATSTSGGATHLSSKAQSTISICALLVMLTLFLFTFSNFEHAMTPSASGIVPRRWLSEKNEFKYKSSSTAAALQGMGTLYRRGTHAMRDLVVAHLTEDLKEDDFRVFLRTLHLSGITSRADLVFISSSLFKFDGLVRTENESFFKLVQNSTQLTGFDLTQFTKERPKGGEPIWGRKNKSSNSSSQEGAGNELSYGSVVGFDASELDPEESLSGFLDHVPIRLRRWACYPMLLGRVRRNFKHIMLVDSKDVILIGDVLKRVRHHGAESVHLWRNSNKKDAKSVTADAIMGGMRGVRWLSNAILNEIVRNAMQRKAKIAISDSAILTQLANKDSFLKSLNVVTSTESSIPSASSLVGIDSGSSFYLLGIVHRDDNNNNNNNNRNVDVNYILDKKICSLVKDSFIYKDCYQTSIV